MYFKSGDVVEWSTRWASNLKIVGPREFKPRQGQAIDYLGKKLYIYYLVLVGSRNGF
jgi:hypothetical protein